GSADGEVCAGEIQVGGYGAQYHVHSAVGVTSVLAARANGGYDGGDQGACGEQSQLLVGFQHAGPRVKEGLPFRIALGLFWRKPEIGEGRLGLAARRSVGQVGFRRLYWGQGDIKSLGRPSRQRHLGDLWCEASGGNSQFIISRREFDQRKATRGVSLCLG